MGILWSSLWSNQETPPAEYDKPWRLMLWGKTDTIRQELMNFKINKPNVRFIRILLVGPVGAGKSSFINSVNNAFQGRITSGAQANAQSQTSFTQIFQTHYIEGPDGSPLSFVFNDVMGLENGEAGAPVQDLIRALYGFLREGHNFASGTPVSQNDHGYRSNPSLEDQSFCLVNIIEANTISMLPSKIFDDLKKIRVEATKLNLPQVIVMTKPDVICPLVNNDVRKIYTSKKIKDKMKMCSFQLGVTMDHIFPVKNYHEEIDPNDDMDLLILKALDQIVKTAVDALKKKNLNFDGKI